MAAPITLPTQLVGPQTFIDFNSLTAASISSGTVVISGVTFSGVSSVIDTDGFPLTASFPTFASDKALGIARGAGVVPIYTITFAADVAQVGFGLWDPNFAGNLVKAFDAAGNLLETTSPDAVFSPGQGGADYLGFVRTTADIRRLELTAGFGGANGTTLDALWVDNLSFSSNPVSAPGTLALALAALASAGALRRRTA